MTHDHHADHEFAVPRSLELALVCTNVIIHAVVCTEAPSKPAECLSLCYSPTGMLWYREDGNTSGDTVMSSPSLVWVTEDGNLALGDMPNVGGYRGRRAALQPKHTLSLALSESVLEVPDYIPALI